MPCFYPIRAYRSRIDGSVVFKEKDIPKYKDKGDAASELRLPCGYCDGCRLERARQWAMRCLHESQTNERNCFITLTYNDENMPMYENLEYRDFQLFMKRLRKRFSKLRIKFFMCGEYGEDKKRPHYHACLFGVDFDDKVHFKKSKTGYPIYTSKTLDDLWSTKNGKIGHASLGDLTFETAGYVARYVMKKVNGGKVDPERQFINVETGEVETRVPEFARMSLGEGIGTEFYRRYKSDMFPRDYVVVNGKKTKPPRFYYKLLKADNIKMHSEIQEEKERRSLGKESDNSPDRLAVKEKVLQAQIRNLKRQ